MIYGLVMNVIKGHYRDAQLIEHERIAHTQAISIKRDTDRLRERLEQLDRDLRRRGKLPPLEN